jgi:hypothetical protein
MAQAIREASAGVWSNPWLLLPLAVALAFGALVGLVAHVGFGAPLLAGLGLVQGFLSPAFLAWWVGWTGEAAAGRRLRPTDIVPTLSHNVSAMYMLLFAYYIATLVLSRIIPFFTVIAVLAPLVLNPWIDFAAEGDLRLERATARMREPVYWLVAATGLILGALFAWVQGLVGGGLVSASLLPGAFPPLSLASVAAYVVATWLWAVRSRLLSDPGVWQSPRMRRFLRESQRRWDEEND